MRRLLVLCLGLICLLAMGGCHLDSYAFSVGFSDFYGTRSCGIDRGGPGWSGGSAVAVHHGHGGGSRCW